MLSVIILTGCNDLRVVDRNGNPIERAEIWGIGYTIGNGPNYTNNKGLGSIPWCIQEIKWINIKKVGFQEITFLPYDWKGIKEITLEAEGE